MSFIAQDFNKLNIITVLEERTQSIIRNHFLRYNRDNSLSDESYYYGLETHSTGIAVKSAISDFIVLLYKEPRNSGYSLRTI